jgi:hypothetical protein
MRSWQPSCKHSRKGRNLLPSQKEDAEALWRQDILGGVHRRQLKSALPPAIGPRLEKPLRSPLSPLFVRTGKPTRRPAGGPQTLHSTSVLAQLAEQQELMPETDNGTVDWLRIAPDSGRVPPIATTATLSGRATTAAERTEVR